MEEQRSKTPILDQITGYKDNRDERRLPLEITVDWINENRPLSQSSLKQFMKSPQHYMEYITEDKPDMKPAWVIGNLVDMMLLTPKGIDDRVAVSPTFNLRTNQGKADKIAFIEANKGKLVVNQEQMNTAYDIGAAPASDMPVRSGTGCQLDQRPGHVIPCRASA